MENQKDRKNSFRNLNPWLIMVGMIIFAWIYIESTGVTNSDFINRTAHFWIIVSIFSIGYGVFYGSLIANTIKKKDYLDLFFLVAIGIIVISSVVYWYILQIQIIPIIQSMDSHIQSGNYDTVHKLMDEQFNLQQKSTNLSIATMIIVMIFLEAPRIIRKFINWKERKNRGEDQ